MKLFLAPENKDAMNAASENARGLSLFHRCQVCGARFAFLSKLHLHNIISGHNPKIGKPVLYNVRVGGNSAAALFDMVR